MTILLYFPGRGNATLQSVQAKTSRYLREMFNKDQKLERMQKYIYIDDRPNIYRRYISSNDQTILHTAAV